MISKLLNHNEELGRIDSKVYSESPHSQIILSGLKAKALHILMRLHLVLIAGKCYYNPLDWFRALIYLIRLRRRFLGNYRLRKVAKVNGKYYMGIYIPPWFSKNFEEFIKNELKSFKPVSTPSYRFNSAFVAITSKCPLQCNHCYEWDRLNQKEDFSVDRTLKIIEKLHKKGICQIYLTGGEPLIKSVNIIQLLKEAPKEIDYWIQTSGYSLNAEKARQLKSAGITGVIVSLDHFDPEVHNRFRKHKDAFYWAYEAVKNAISNNLVVALSLCVTKDFISRENLMTYMELARQWGVSFVQIIEPKAIGHFKNLPVELNSEEKDILEQFHLDMNFTKLNNNFPIIGYHEQYQRKQGCLSAGQKSIYIDLYGNLHACPFCQNGSGNILSKKFDEHLELLTSRGCERVNNW